MQCGATGIRVYAPFLSLRGGLDVDSDSDPGGEGDQHFKAELFPFAPDQIGHADWLTPRILAALAFI